MMIKLEQMDKELLEALDDTTLDDLHNALIRYGFPEFKTDEDCLKRFPNATMELVLLVIQYSDECPVCYHRFIKMKGNHSDVCALKTLLDKRCIEI